MQSHPHWGNGDGASWKGNGVSHRGALLESERTREEANRVGRKEVEGTGIWVAPPAVTTRQPSIGKSVAEKVGRKGFTVAYSMEDTQPQARCETSTSDISKEIPEVNGRPSAPGPDCERPQLVPPPGPFPSGSSHSHSLPMTASPRSEGRRTEKATDENRMPGAGQSRSPAAGDLMGAPVCKTFGPSGGWRSGAARAGPRTARDHHGEGTPPTFLRARP